jgi:hypothetical protein
VLTWQEQIEQSFRRRELDAQRTGPDTQVQEAEQSRHSAATAE